MLGLRASICHNDDNWQDPRQRRVPLFYDQDADAWVNHETNEILFRIPHGMTPEEAINEVYGEQHWDLKITQNFEPPH